MTNPLTAKDVAKILNRSSSWVTGLCKMRLIPFYKIGGRYYFDPSDLDRWIKGHKVNSEADYRALRPTLLKEIKAGSIAAGRGQ